MKTLIPTLLTAFCTLCSSVSVLAMAENSVLRLANGDQISCDILGLKEQKLSVDCKHFVETHTEFPAKELLSIYLPQLKPVATEKRHLATITLSDRIGSPQQHDTIQGELVSISANEVTLATDFAGTIDVDRSLISSIKIGTRSKKIYQGPLSASDWLSHDENRQWNFANNALTSLDRASTIAKEFDLPDKSVLRFQVDSILSPIFKIYLFASEVNTSQPKHFYELRMRNKRLTMSRKNPRRGLMSLRAQRNTRGDIRTRQNTFTIYMDRKEGTFHIFINGEYLDTFIEQNPSLDGLGSSIHLRDEYGQSISFKNISISEWKGLAPIPNNPQLERHLGKEGEVVHLINGDMLRGEIGEIKDDTIAIKTSLASFQVPLAGISILSQKDKLDNQAKEDRNDVKAHFHNGGWIIIDVDSMDSTHIYGNNEAIGDAKFRIDAFHQIDFNIYNCKANKLRQSLNAVR